jgi:hypothetical protein
MNGANPGRWIPLSGIVYVVLFVLVFVLTGDSPQGSDPDSEYLAYYGDSGNRNQEIVVFFLLAVAAIAFVWFVAHLRGRLRAVESEPHGLSTLAFGSGLVSAALLMGALAVGIGPTFAVEDSDVFTLDPDMARLTGVTSYLLLVGSTMVAAALVAATSVLAIRTTVLPAWVGWVGLVVALVMLFAIAWIPIMVYLAWVLVVSVLLLVRPEAPRSARGAVAEG